jgi:predicted RNA-binding Zn ribbon-like protein
VTAVADVPPGLALVEAFLNSVDVDAGSDEFATVDGYSAWLAARGLPATGATGADLADARALRDALRTQAYAHHDRPAPDSAGRAALDSLAARIRLCARFPGSGSAALESAEDGARRVLGEVLAGVVLADRDGSWARLKICREDTCQWVFYDHSKNSSKQWCSMQGCGNRNKSRAYRARQRS